MSISVARGDCQVFQARSQRPQQDMVAFEQSEQKESLPRSAYNARRGLQRRAPKPTHRDSLLTEYSG